MARIKTYVNDTLISENDKIIGTDAEDNQKTKNYNLGSLKNFVLSGLDPEVGGNLKITTISHTSSTILTPEDYFNTASPAIQVEAYEIVFLILNGRTYIFRLNGDTYGVGESQVVNLNFTEIDITSVISASTQDLDSVLSEGNTSELPAYIGSIGLYNEAEDTYMTISIDNNEYNFNNEDDHLMFKIEDKSISIVDTTSDNSFSIVSPSLSLDRVATLQNSSGTIAYLSDIPSTGVFSIIEGDNITISEDEGDVTINSSYQNNPLVQQCILKNTLTSTNYFYDGSVFEYDASLYPLNAFSLKFNENVEISGSTNIGCVYAKYQEGVVKKIEINSSNVFVNGSSVDFVFDMDSLWKATEGEKILELYTCVYPNKIKSVSSELFFNGAIPQSISNFYVAW